MSCSQRSEWADRLEITERQSNSNKHRLHPCRTPPQMPTYFFFTLSTRISAVACCWASFFFLLNYLLHSLTLWSRKRNSTKHFQKEKKKKMGENEIPLFDHGLDSRWTVNNKLSAQRTSPGRSIPFSWDHALHDLSAVAEPSTVVRFLEIPHKFSTITAALSDLPIFFQHSCTRGCWNPEPEGQQKPFANRSGHLPFSSLQFFLVYLQNAAWFCKSSQGGRLHHTELHQNFIPPAKQYARDGNSPFIRLRPVQPANCQINSHLGCFQTEQRSG